MFLSLYATLKQTTTTKPHQGIMVLLFVFNFIWRVPQVTGKCVCTGGWALLRALACAKGASRLLAVS